MNYRASTLALIALAALGACQGRTSDETPPEPTPTATPLSGGDETVSILRPDIEQPDVPTEIEPLRVTIGFAEGGDELDEVALGQLRDKVLYSRQIYGPGTVTIGGHSDSGGTDAANMRASEARAQAVADWLTEQGIEGQRITVIAFGEQNPVEPNALPDGTPNEAGRAANRRVEIDIPGGEFSSAELADIDASIAADRGTASAGDETGSVQTGD